MQGFVEAHELHLAQSLFPLEIVNPKKKKNNLNYDGHDDVVVAMAFGSDLLQEFRRVLLQCDVSVLAKLSISQLKP